MPSFSRDRRGVPTLLFHLEALAINFNAPPNCFDPLLAFVKSVAYAFPKLADPAGTRNAPTVDVTAGRFCLSSLDLDGDLSRGD
jgi:hypothetical protein